nr:U32 family peptidase [uncultured Blautia sp.]
MRTELLAPAGSYEGLQAVVKAGADAVYIGGRMFGARAYAKNPEKDEMLEAIDYAHLHGKKIYLTVNTLLKNQELFGELYDFLAPYYAQGLDAVIVQDFGVLSFIKKEFPGLPIHASTQMAVTGPHGAGLIQEAGASRIVTARELSLKEIRDIYERTGAEIESFVHGALCYCYSGMCLFSSMLGGRSGNRGRCAQPCRLPYTAYQQGKQINGKNQSYLLSPKDMCTIEILPELLQAGVYSLKIEGRMKRPEYAAGVTAIYRKYLDLFERHPESYQIEAEDMQELLDLYQRDGFNKGYYQVHNGKEMMAVRNQKEQNKKQNIQGKRNEVLFERLKKQYLDAKLQEKITGTLVLCTDAPAVLDLDFQNTHVQVMGDMVEPAQRQPLTQDRVKKQMEKTGQTPFAFEHLEVITDEAGFLPMQSLNELRRAGLEKLEASYLSQYRRKLPEKDTESWTEREETLDSEQKWYVSVEQKEQWEAALSQEEVDGIYCSISMYSVKNFREEVLQDIQVTHQAGKEYYLTLPYVLREGRLDNRIQAIREVGKSADGFVIRNLEELGYLKNLGLERKAVGDYSLYSFNDLSQNFLEDMGLLRTTVPLELNGKEIRRKECSRSEMIVYGYYPMMISAQCVKKTCGTCDHQSGTVQLKDRYGNYFMTKSFCDFCYTVIYNSVPTSLWEETEQIKSAGVQALRMNFTWENRKECKRLLEFFVQKKKNAFKMQDATKGHFKRGVE